MSNCQAGRCVRPVSENRSRCDYHLKYANERGKTDASKARASAYRARLKEHAINQYGGACACCGLTYLPYLQLDHVNGGGRTHREGKPLYRVLKGAGWPTDPPIQVLCANCHQAKTIGADCLPH